MKKYIIIVLVVSVFLPFLVKGQRNVSNEQISINETEKQANIALQDGKFEKAILLYRRLLNQNTSSPKLNFLLGYCYLNTEFGLDKAIEHLKLSVESTTENISDRAPLESYYYLAKAYFLNNSHQEAVELLDELLVKIPDREIFFKQKVRQLKESCQNAMMMNQTKAKIEVENVGELNSKYSDKNPLIWNNGKEIIFTSRRENSQYRNKQKGSELDEDIYYSKFENGIWSVPYSLGSSINTVEHESACWISNDGNFLIIRRFYKNKSNIFFCKKQVNGAWSVPQKFSAPINSKNRETFGSLSPDGKYLFFTSDRHGGYGENDIYMSENLGDNKWGPAVNLGPEINTSLNEESPYMHENGMLFFCSQGHVSMGGFDIFSSYRDYKGEWQKAVNLGTPINSIDDDFFYQPLPDGQYAFSSSQRYGSKGESDIFKYELTDSTGMGYALVAGKINCSKPIEMDKTVEIYLREMQDKYKMVKYRPNKHGDFSFILPAAKNYQITYSYKRQVFYEATLEIPKSYSYFANDQSIRLKDVELNIYDDTQLIKPGTVGASDVYLSNNKTTESMVLANKKKNAEIAESDTTYALASTLDRNTQLADSNASGIIYSIKLASSRKKLSLSSFSEIEDVKEYREKSGNYIYYFGAYNYEWEAEIKLRLIRENYPNAKVFVNTIGKNPQNIN